jgi:hypothetical protein
LRIGVAQFRREDAVRIHGGVAYCSERNVKRSVWPWLQVAIMVALFGLLVAIMGFPYFD